MRELPLEVGKPVVLYAQLVHLQFRDALHPHTDDAMVAEAPPLGHPRVPNLQLMGYQNESSRCTQIELLRCRRWRAHELV